MDYVNKLIVRVRESQKGQTMTEYVLIIAAIAVAGYVAYEGLEGGINTIIANVTTTLAGA
ncbi:Flp family type IVb pilin [Candidatus Binatus sp.]|jgi:Flp pilus assembly pilin Flp|uniref:Flp family type IVb pilin n=1 Tax=Candidatus Binatus sp. TaxID=2811406 RepID=UPI003BEBD459